jgi:hypothetical protein
LAEAQSTNAETQGLAGSAGEGELFAVEADAAFAVAFDIGIEDAGDGLMLIEDDTGSVDIGKGLLVVAEPGEIPDAVEAERRPGGEEWVGVHSVGSWER